MRRSSFILLFMMIAVWVMAQSVTPEKARKTAVEFMRQVGMKTSQVKCKSQSVSSLSINSPYYIFDAGNNNGFVVVSGDERTQPILGYVTQGTFDERLIPENMQVWLRGYADQIEQLQEGFVSSRPLKVPSHPAVRTLLTTKWNQGIADANGSAYNMKCPQINGNYCLTGCLATAMAQLMKYHQWPESFSTEIPAYKSNSTIGNLALLPAFKFDWSQMLDKYSGSETEEQKNAVAQLMRYCGQSVEMNYGLAGSGAVCDNVAKALRTYYGYDTNTRYVMRSDYTAATWDELIYNELSEGRPVLYNGSSTGGGHAFVCDGFDGKGFYHINWGWGGFLDGYFRLSVLNPDGGGAGSSGTNDGYSMDQGAVVGIQSPTGYDDEMRMLTLEDFYADGTVLNASYCNRTGLEGNFDIGFVFENLSDESGTLYISDLSATLEAFNHFNVNVDISLWEMADGVYRFYPYSRLTGAGWYRVSGDFNTYLEVTVSGGEITEIEKHPKPDLTFDKIECVSSKVVNMVQEIKTTVSNTGDEFSGVLYLFASRNKSNKGSCVNKTGVVVETGTTEEANLYFTPKYTGTWYVWVSTDEKGKGLISQTQVEIRNLPVTATNLEIVSCEIEARPTSHVHLKLKNVGEDGYFMPLYCYLFPSTWGYSLDGKVSGNLNLAKGDTVDLTFDFEDLTVGNEYIAVFFAYADHLSDNTVWLDGHFPFTVQADQLRGDVNSDGTVDISDVLTTVDYILGKDCQVFDRDNADVVQDGEINISDVLEIVNVILGK